MLRLFDFTDEVELAAFIPDSWPPLLPMLVSRPGLPLSRPALSLPAPRPDARLPLPALPELLELPEPLELPELAERPELPLLPEALIPLSLRSLRLLLFERSPERSLELSLELLLEWLLPLLCLLAIRTPPDLELELGRVREPSNEATDMPSPGATRDLHRCITGASHAFPMRRIAIAMLLRCCCVGSAFAITFA